MQLWNPVESCLAGAGASFVFAAAWDEVTPRLRAGVETALKGLLSTESASPRSFKAQVSARASAFCGGPNAAVVWRRCDSDAEGRESSDTTLRRDRDERDKTGRKSKRLKALTSQPQTRAITVCPAGIDSNSESPVH